MENAAERAVFVVLGLLTFKEAEEEDKDKGYLRGPAHEVGEAKLGCAFGPYLLFFACRTGK